MSKVKELVSDLLHKDGNRAAWIDSQGARIRVAASERPTPESNEIIIKVHAIGVNPLDWKMQDTGFFVKKWPVIVGNDVAGEVHAVGASVTRFKVGDRVVSQVLGVVNGDMRQSGFQHYVAAGTDKTAIIPAGISYTDASVLPVGFNTAAVGLYKPRGEGFLGLAPPSLNPTPSGEVILVWGASSSVGSQAVQLAVASGGTVVGVASERNHAFVKKLGARAVVDYRSAGIVDEAVQAVKAAGGTFVGALDAISTPDSFRHLLPILERLGGGSAALVLPLSEEKPANVQVGSIFAGEPITHSLWESFVTPALESGKLRLVPEALVIGKGLESVQKGLDKNKKGVSARKVVVQL